MHITIMYGKAKHVTAIQYRHDVRTKTIRREFELLRTRNSTIT